MSKLFPGDSDADAQTKGAVLEVEEEYHRFGQTRLLNTISVFASSGGMAEAATWLSLRQEIRVSFTTKSAFKIELANYTESRAFIAEDEGSWANRIVFLTAKILTAIFNEILAISPKEWNSLSLEVEAWNEDKPTSFDPMWTTSAISESDIRLHATSLNASAFPEVIMCQDAHVVGIQYYCMSKLLLAIYNPHISRQGFEVVRRRRDADQVAVEQLRLIVGLALSNKAGMNASITAFYCLQACGFWLSGKAEQEEAIEFLSKVEQSLGWDTSQIIPRLKASWNKGGKYR